ncbi:uncharacterized protein ASCRUDRAFT_79157 [Ascoidea rubescens DSM 1968]|uniref:Uncharacterized protein n=1 Tax=Ascoidea rubescens DSM 1968 TaxID=1344418 RepID=A0A1D2VRQ7_9ASCO|nr:hypothetical protein ASCRUDRAFT_79157 [Ascoidea rubescens DSM 1968]ODV64280.1 hypothetical protein ASCRUDRAFT_79157 [Ascoidea rubescens DSM 1968]
MNTSNYSNVNDILKLVNNFNSSDNSNQNQNGYINDQSINLNSNSINTSNLLQNAPFTPRPRLMLTNHANNSSGNSPNNRDISSSYSPFSNLNHLDRYLGSRNSNNLSRNVIEAINDNPYKPSNYNTPINSISNISEVSVADNHENITKNNSNQKISYLGTGTNNSDNEHMSTIENEIYNEIHEIHDLNETNRKLSKDKHNDKEPSSNSSSTSFLNGKNISSKSSSKTSNLAAYSDDSGSLNHTPAPGENNMDSHLDFINNLEAPHDPEMVNAFHNNNLLMDKIQNNIAEQDDSIQNIQTLLERYIPQHTIEPFDEPHNENAMPSHSDENDFNVDQFIIPPSSDSNDVLLNTANAAEDHSKRVSDFIEPTETLPNKKRKSS